MIPNPGELADQRRAFASIFPQQATILRQSRADDSLGGQSQSWATIGTTPILLYAAGTQPQERAMAGGVAAAGDWEAMVPIDAPIRGSDRLEVDGRTFEVRAAWAGEYFALAQRLALAEVT